MTRCGFEFEFLSTLEDDEILDDLGPKYNVVTDPSIRFDENTLKRDGWRRWEIITPPESKTKALKTLEEIQRYLVETNARTNSSCGFHVNVSATDMTRFDPMTLIATTEEYLISKTFNRENNPYCVIWAEHFEFMWNKIKKREGLTRNKVFVDNCRKLVEASAYGEWIPEEFKYAKTHSKGFADKYVSINVSKLAHGYVEFRSIGGIDYHLKMLEPFVKNFIDVVNMAAKGKNNNAIKDYFESNFIFA